MSKLLKAFVLIALLGCVATAQADPPGRVARVNLVNGPVSFAPAEAPDEWVQAPVNRPITSGDRLWADNGGRAELHLGSTALRLASYTNVDVLNLDDRAFQLRLAQGSLNLRVRDVEPGDTLEIATPGGAVLVRQPGSYRINTDPRDGTTRVLVAFGQAEIVTPAQTLTVPSGQSALVGPNAPPSFEVAAYAAADDFDRWSADRDRREDRVESARYVSREMTGYEDLDQYGAWRTYPEYGAVWMPQQVQPGWAPYRYGHWAWVAPWGWTWIDDAPWGFAPFHYGRWVQVDGGYWGWAPGPVVRRPVYAPALVAFVGGSGFSVSVRSGPAVGWFPLGWREPYRPWYRASPAYVRNVNVTHVTNVTSVTNINYVNRHRPEAVTVVPQQAFVSARPVAQSVVSLRREELARAQVLQDRPPAEPVRASFAAERAGRRPPREAIAREAVMATPPATSVVAQPAPAVKAEQPANAAVPATRPPQALAAPQPMREWPRSDAAREARIEAARRYEAAREAHREAPRPDAQREIARRAEREARRERAPDAAPRPAPMPGPAPQAEAPRPQRADVSPRAAPAAPHPHHQTPPRAERPPQREPQRPQS